MLALAGQALASSNERSVNIVASWHLEQMLRIFSLIRGVFERLLFEEPLRIFFHLPRYPFGLLRGFALLGFYYFDHFTHSPRLDSLFFRGGRGGEV